MGDLNMPTTYLRRIGGSVILDGQYNAVMRTDLSSEIPSNCNRLILKPAVDSCSGHGVLLFERKGSQWISSKNDEVLSHDFLLSYRDDFVLQEAVAQHSYIAQFCETSFNTMRIATYRSVVDEKIHVLGCVLRIGRKGSYLDNAHAGGSIIGIDTATGLFDNYLVNQYGIKSTTWNGIDFSKSQFEIPNLEKIIEFAKAVAMRNQRNRLLALDIGLDANGEPILIESNIGGFGYWMFMFSGRTVFGEYTDEIIDYCATNQHLRIQRFKP
jgi:hypothetical protein